jgi:hypothetical protein
MVVGTLDMYVRGRLDAPKVELRTVALVFAAIESLARGERAEAEALLARAGSHIDDQTGGHVRAILRLVEERVSSTSDLGTAELALAGTALLLFRSSKGEPSRGLLQQVLDAARTVA